MTLAAEHYHPPVEDPVSNVLKWVLLVVAIATFGLLAWATVMTYRAAPPQPDRFVSASGAVLMTNQDIVAGKGGFQKAENPDRPVQPRAHQCGSDGRTRKIDVYPGPGSPSYRYRPTRNRRPQSSRPFAPF